jgi:hypothetical protein
MKFPPLENRGVSRHDLGTVNFDFSADKERLSLLKEKEANRLINRRSVGAG